MARSPGTRSTGKYGASWNQSTGKRAEEVALGECGASGCKVVGRVGPRMCGALATTEDGKQAGAAWRKDREAARLAALKSCGKDEGRRMHRPGHRLQQIAAGAPRRA